jgi:hypothetical protein
MTRVAAKNDISSPRVSNFVREEVITAVRLPRDVSGDDLAKALAELGSANPAKVGADAAGGASVISQPGLRCSRKTSNPRGVIENSA